MNAIAPESIDISALPFLPLSDRRLLPKVPCIYFAIDSLGTVQYVGRSVNLRQRWTGHHRYDQLEVMADVRLAWLEVSDGSLLPKIEEALIEWFRPPLNRYNAFDCVPPPFTKRSDRKAVQQSKVKIRCRLQDLLEAQGMTRSALAEATSLNSAAIRGLCDNSAKRYDADTLAVLCDFFECGVGDLFELLLKESEENSVKQVT